MKTKMKMKPGTKVRLLRDDAIGRWSKGEVGVLIKNTFDKYDYAVQLPVKDMFKRVYFFYEQELERA